ncbi:MAG: peptide chain release factor N(5)-glutamine methyltransferase, partial [Nitrospirales bacterium]|nr:peptide chain release factor N(5)-glutamine methyltransferase [Nitrospirales bacterium]
MTGLIRPVDHPYEQLPFLFSSMTIDELWWGGAAMLARAGIAQPDNEAVWILESALGQDRLGLHLNKNERVEERDRNNAMALFERRASREPLQYVLGTQEFCGLDFRVTPDVLIPRPETELLVEVVRQTCANTSGALIADIGTGSGCIAIALARALPMAILYATDRSPQALAVAQENAKRHDVQDRVNFLVGDLFEPLQGLELQGRLVAIASNPPYIGEGDLAGLQPEVGLFEPRLALAGGNDGLFF